MKVFFHKLNTQRCFLDTMNLPLLKNQLHRLLWQHGLLLLGLALYMLDKHEGLLSGVITGLLLAAAAGKTGYFLVHNFRALAALRETFQQFLLLV